MADLLLKSENLLQFWFGPNGDTDNSEIWFNNPNIDEIITTRFYDYLNHFEINSHESHPKIILAKIILFDQLTRHFYRNEPEKYNLYSDDVCKLVIFAINNKYDISYSSLQRCFLLLPLRHSNNFEYLKIADKMIKKYMNYELLSCYKRFYYHNLKLLTKHNTLSRFFPTIMSNSYIFDSFIYNTVIDRSTRSYFDRFDYTRTIYDFNKQKLGSTNIYQTVRQFIKQNNITQITISLSGGVDSMLLATCLLLLKDRNELDLICAVHINYGNSQKSKWEREFILRFCLRHNILIFIRDIDEILRSSELREIYENVTKDIRYHMYKLTNCPVMLGHNHDDSLENLITNIRKSQHFDNLYGMSSKTIINDVVICRPLLNVTKIDIISTATSIDLYHTCNSTPVWSDRWKIRNVFLEFVEHEEPGFIRGLESIKTLLEDSYKIITNIVNDIDKQITFNDNNITIPFYNDIFAYQVWRSIFHKLAIKQICTPPSNKALLHFMSLLSQSTNDNQINVQISKQIKCKITSYSIIITITKSDVTKIIRQ